MLPASWVPIPFGFRVPLLTDPSPGRRDLCKILIDIQCMYMPPMTMSPCHAHAHGHAMAMAMAMPMWWQSKLVIN